MLGSDSTPPLILVLFVDDIRVAGPGDAVERFIAYLRSTHKCKSKHRARRGDLENITRSEGQFAIM
jgi:hypothetical protein